MKRFKYSFLIILLLIPSLAFGGIHLALGLGGGSHRLEDTFTDMDAVLLQEHHAESGGYPWRYSSSTWTISSNAVINTPTLGGELGDNVGFEDGGAGNPWLPTGWSNAGLDAGESANDAVIFHSGANAFHVGPIGVGHAYEGITDDKSLTTGVWHALSVWVYPISGRGALTVHGQIGIDDHLFSASGGATWEQLKGFGLCTGASANSDYFLRAVDNNGEVVFDDFSIKPLTTAELFAVTNTGFSSGYVKLTDTVIEAGSILGAAMCVDSPANPQNGFIAIANRTAGNFQVYALNSGTWTSLIDTAFTYAAGAEIVLLLDENKKYLYAFYNNGGYTRQDVSSYTTIINNTYHGMFSPSSGNSVSKVDIKSLQFESDVVVSGITKASPGVVTATGHGYSNGDLVNFHALTEMTELNGYYDAVENKADNTFQTINTSGFGAAETTGGNCVRKVQ